MSKKILNKIGTRLKTPPTTGKRREVVTFLRANPGIAFSTNFLLEKLSRFYVNEKDLTSAYRLGYTLRISSKYFEFTPNYFETDEDFFILDKSLKHPIKASCKDASFKEMRFIYFSPKEGDIDEIFEEINSLKRNPLDLQIAIGDFFKKKYMVKNDNNPLEA